MDTNNEDSPKLSLKQKIQFILDKYNNGEETNYAENMLFAIKEAENRNKEYDLNIDSVSRLTSYQFSDWSLAYLLGECILNNNEDFFKA